jgi:subtilase family serine protease
MIQNDLDLFNATFGLPSTTLTIITPDGLTPFDITDDNQVGWSAEISLDVQWAHAMAPGAKIDLVLAKSSDDADINSAVRYAVDHNLGDVISMSFGEGEACMTNANLTFQHETFKRAVRKGITLVASSGDDGAGQGTQGPDACDFGTAFFKSASTPASDPLVTGVGGTTLFAQDPAVGKQGYQGERAWSDEFSGSLASACFPPADFGCSGGGFSRLFDRPQYQAGIPNTNSRRRGVPDVAYNAGVDGGVLTHWGIGLVALLGLNPGDDDFDTTFFIIGGTSAGAPQWSALVALADQLGHHRVGTINDALYALARNRYLYGAAFHDITSGNNNLDTVDGTIHGFNAKKNWDAVTGLGSPKAGFLVPYLALVSH